MLRLLLMRHAEARRATPEIADFDLPLSERARDATPGLASFVAANGISPGRILCSAAQRAKETLALLIPHLPGEIDICIHRRLYETDGAGYLTAIREFGATDPCVLVIGHNPATEHIAAVLAPIGDAAGLAAMKAQYPPGGLAVIDFDAAEWADIGPGAGRLISFHTPASIAAD